jgi:hypothetical protein
VVCSSFGVAMSLGMDNVLAKQALGKAQDSLRFPVSRMRDFSFRNVWVWDAGIAMLLMRIRAKMEAG